MPASSGTITPKPLPSALLMPLEPDWSDPVQITTSYLSGVSRGQETLSEERWARRWRPLRGTTFTHLARNQRQLNEALSFLLTSQSVPVPVPLYPDATILTSDVSPGGTSLSVGSTANRRLFVGQRVVLVQITMSLTPGSVPFEYATVASLGASSVGLTAGLARGWAANATIVVPCFDAQVSLSHELPLLSSQVGNGEFSFSEIAGDNTLLGLWEGAVGGSVGQKNGLDVFPFPVQFTEPTLRILREGTITQLGVADVASLYGESSIIAHTSPFLFSTRSSFWEFLKFFEARMGRREAFFLPSSAIQITPQLLTTVGLLCEVLTLTPEVSPYRYLAIKSSTHGLQVAEINPTVGVGITNNVGNTQTTIVFNEVLASVPALSDIQWVAFCYKSRFAQDVLEESWYTCEVCETEVEFHTLISETSLPLSNL